MVFPNRILIFAIVLKLTVYLCWYQVRRSSATRQVRIILPDGTTQCAVITARGRSQQSHRSGEERQVNISETSSKRIHLCFLNFKTFLVIDHLEK